LISEQVLSQQLIRLGALRGAPDSVDEVMHAYREASKNPAHASRITAWLLRHSTFFPTPSEVYTAAAQSLLDDDLPRADAGCSSCHGTGYGRAWQLVTYTNTSGGGSHKSVDIITDPDVAQDLRRKVDQRNQLLYECAPRCRSCNYGRALAIAEESRGAA
jgi:hypothetical protein